MSRSLVVSPRIAGRRLAARQSLPRYRPFGRTLTQPTNPALHIGFTGHDRTTADTSLNLVYMNARYYMPGIGRFLSADTLIPDPAESQAFNRYSYVYNNPINYTDPTGHLTEDEIRDYFGYTSREAMLRDGYHQELVDWLWHEDTRWGDVFTYYDSNGNYLGEAMLVLLETGLDSNLYRGAFWGLNGKERGKPVSIHFIQGLAVTRRSSELEQQYRNKYEELPRQYSDDGFSNYHPISYIDVITLSNFIAFLTVSSLVVGAVSCVVAAPCGVWGIAGLVISGASTAGLVFLPPESNWYPILQVPNDRVTPSATTHVIWYRSPKGWFAQHPQYIR